MTTTTSYGTWNNNADNMSLTIGQTVIESLGDFASDYDTDAITADYRQAINDALPHNVSLCGDEFIGPYYEADQHFDGYPAGEDGRLDIKAIVDSIDFWTIAGRHDKTA